MEGWVGGGKALVYMYPFCLEANPEMKGHSRCRPLDLGCVPEKRLSLSYAKGECILSWNRVKYINLHV